MSGVSTISMVRSSAIELRNVTDPFYLVVSILVRCTRNPFRAAAHFAWTRTSLLRSSIWSIVIEGD